jgi:hypothetical protein
MANLVLEKNGEFWQVFDADQGLTVFSSTNQGVAQAFINNGVVDPETVRRFAQQTINYQGGIDTEPGPVSFATNPQVSADQETSTPLTDFQLAGNTDGYGSQNETLDFENIAISPGGYTPAQLNEIARAQGVDTGEITDQFSPNVITEQDLYDQENAAAESSARARARQQQTISQQRRQINNGDWRVRLRLAPQADYLYKANQPGILQPLAVTDGVIFPYTPSITSNYKANYSTYDLTHSNYRGYFYQNSYAEPVQITCTFTAQSTVEANYLLAVITFFKSVTKMFYGQDAQRGAPPPLTYLTGLGEYQFNEHPCLVTQFNYALPADVDYIRAGSPNQLGLNQINQRDRQSVSTGSLFGGLNRLAAALLTKGAIPQRPPPPTLGTNRPTYVPTKIELSITLLPIQSRNQVSKQFSLENFANGNLIKGGFW